MAESTGIDFTLMSAATISIVSHGQGELVQMLLDDLARHAARSCQAIVVTKNVPEDWTPPAVLGGIPVTLIENPRPLGFAANHNQAFARCSTPWFAVLNPDLRLTLDPFPALIESLEFARCGLVAPVQVDGHGATEDFKRRIPTPLALLRRAIAKRLGSPRRLTADHETEWVSGAFMLLRSEAMRDVGGFDERYRLYCEDVDLCLRLQLKDWTIAVRDDVVVVHDARRHSGRHMRYLSWHLGSLARLWLSRPFWSFILNHRWKA
jgi:hypothetical protein